MATERTVEEHNEIERRRRVSDMRRIRDAMLAVFGPPGKRTPMGAIILEELERFTNYRRPCPQQDTVGQTDVYRTGVQEGRRQVIETLHNAIDWKEPEHVDTSSTGGG
jgi:hypothetical protein